MREFKHTAQYQLWQNDEVLKLREVHDQCPVIFMPKMRRERLTSRLRRMAVLARRGDDGGLLLKMHFFAANQGIIKMSGM